MAISKSKGPNLKSRLKGGESDAQQNVPSEFRAALDISVSDQAVPEDVQPEVLDRSTVLASKVTQEHTNERRKRTVTIPPGPVTLTELDTNAKQQRVIRARTFESTDAQATSLDALTTVRQKNLGNGFQVEDVERIDNVFPAAVFDLERPDVIPPEFAANVPKETLESEVAGQATLPTLAPEDVHRSETQVNNFVKRALRAFRTFTFPVVLNETFRGGVTAAGSLFSGQVARVRTLTNSIQAITTGAFNLLDSRVRNLGNGMSVKEDETQATFPVLQDHLFDDKTGVVVDRTKTVVDPSTPNPAGSSTLSIDADRSVKLTEVVNSGSLTTNYNFAGTTSIELPTELISLTALYDSSASAGDYNSGGNYAFQGSGNAQASLGGQAQASASAVVDIDHGVKQVWGNNVPCLHVLFIATQANATQAAILSRVSSIVGAGVNPWPIFRPKSIVLFCHGGKLNGSALVTAHWDDSITVDADGSIVFTGSGRLGAHGSSFDVSSSYRAVRIPPTIHGALNVTNAHSAGSPFTAVANATAALYINTILQQQLQVVVQAISYVEPASIPATPGQATIPTGGLYAHRISTEPYRTSAGTNYILVHVEVVDFGVINPP